MICQNCNTQNENNAVYCSNCNNFLNYDRIKELFILAKEYIQKKDFYDAAVIILNCIKLSKGTQHEKQLTANLKVVKIKFQKDNEAVKNKIQDALNYQKNKNNEEALKIWNTLLELNILTDETNKKIIKRIEILKNTIYPENINENVKDVIQKKQIKYNNTNFYKIAISIVIIIITAGIINFLFISKRKIPYNYETLPSETQTIGKNNSVNENLKINPVKDIIFFTGITGIDNTFSFNNTLNQIDAYSIINDFPVTIQTKTGRLTFSFNNSNIIINLQNNSSLTINYDTDLILQFNNGRFFVNNNHDILNISTPYAKGTFPENVFIINNFHDRNEIIIGPYLVEQGMIINKNFPRYNRQFQRESIITVLPDAIPDNPVNVTNTKYYKEMLDNLYKEVQYDG